MDGDSGQRTPVWTAHRELPDPGPLTTDLRVDVCVIGAGIAGLSTAYTLARQGVSVAVLDRGRVGRGETVRTTAHLASALDDRFYELERLFGRDGARLAAESHAASIDRIEEIARTEGIDCGFERLDGYLFAPPGGSQEELDDELEAARRAGLFVERVPRAPLPHYDTGPCLRFANQAQFDPISYLEGLVRAIQSDRGRIFTRTAAVQVEGGCEARVTTEAGPVVTARAAVVATNSPILDDLIPDIQQAAYRTYAIAARIPAGSIPRALYWDTVDPYHYVRLTRDNGDGDLLLVGGEDHRTGQEDNAAERFGWLESWARERFLIQNVEHRWSGQVLEPTDGLAFLGPPPTGAANLFIATGDSGHGMTHGTLAGMILGDLVLGRDNRWASLYSPRRLRWATTGDFVRENANIVAQYVDWVTPAEVSSTDEIAPGRGALLRRGLTKMAVYRDESGELHERSAICPHLGCIVAWNPAERTWDCPCHGSRFDPQGRVLNGPTKRGLSRT